MLRQLNLTPEIIELNKRGSGGRCNRLREQHWLHSLWCIATVSDFGGDSGKDYKIHRGLNLSWSEHLEFQSSLTAEGMYRELNDVDSASMSKSDAT